MSKLMAVLLNGVAQLEYDRTKKLTDYQLTYIHNMDIKMDEEGVEIAGKLISSPDENQKAQFVKGDESRQFQFNERVVHLFSTKYA